MIVAAIIECAVLLYYPDVKVFTEEGLIGSFQKLLEILVPFYIVALAAVATFEREGLDEVMKGRPALLTVRDAKSQTIEVALTRRQFICYLFGYLAILSLLLFVFVIMFNVLGERIGETLFHWLGAQKIWYLKIAVIYGFLFPIWQMIITTVLGIYFLSERLQVMQETER